MFPNKNDKKSTFTIMRLLKIMVLKDLISTHNDNIRNMKYKNSELQNLVYWLSWEFH